MLKDLYDLLIMAIKITYFVHGTTTDNEQSLASGWLPGQLSQTGIKQARELANLIPDKRFDVLFCSDLKRAVDSARLAFTDKCAIVTDKRLRECHYGDYTKKHTRIFEQNINNYINNSFPNGESYKDVEKRMKSFLIFLKKKYNGKNIALMSHHAPQLALDVLIKGKTWEQALKEDWRRKKAWQPGWDYLLDD